jgi:hypothetical protein
MERLLRNAQNITSCTSTSLNYSDEFGNSTNFVCSGGANGFIASGSARLTSTNVLVNCTGAPPVFTCPVSPPGVPDTIQINVSGRESSTSGAGGGQITSITKVLLRNYTGL